MGQSKSNRRGKGARPLLESEIRAAQSISNSALETARNLGVAYDTYKKWAKRYGIHKVNQGKKGGTKVHRDPNKGKYPLNKILNGDFPDYPTHAYKKKLFSTGTKEECCENCGFNEARVTDDKIPLVIDYHDDDPKNKHIDNIVILCYNCMHNIGSGSGRGLVRGSKHFMNADNLQRKIEKTADLVAPPKKED